MKKTLCTILAFTMIVSIFTFALPVSADTAVNFGKVDASYAPAGEPVNTAADFAAMTANGSYYLNADITIDATWNGGNALSATYESNTAFTGTFDGNGHTITTTVALFASFSGTVKNLTVEGEIAEAKVGDTLLNGANIALWSKGKSVFENVYTKANIVAGKDSAALLPFGASGCDITVRNCRNDANVKGEDRVAGLLGFITDKTVLIEGSENHGRIESTGNYGTGIISILGYKHNLEATDVTCTIRNTANYGEVIGTRNQSAGILSYLKGNGVIEGCTNYGNVTNPDRAAGIFGRTENSSRTTAISIDKCANYGKITGNYYVAGIAAQLGTDPVIKTFAYIATNCENHGDLYATAVADQALYVGGIAAFNYCGTGAVHGILNSVNTGNIYVDSTATTAAVHVAGIVSNVTGVKYQFRNNINTGNITVNGNATYVALTFINQAANALTATENNYSVAVGTYPAGVCPVSFEAKHAKIETDKIVSGEIAHTLNTAMGTEHFYQKVGDASTLTLKEATDGSNKIVKNDDGTYSNPAKKPENPDTADVIGYAIVLGGIALVGIVFIAAQKKRTVKAK